MSVLVEGKRLWRPGNTEVWPWWVGPDPTGRWHVALAPDKPNENVRTLAEAVCGLKPPTRWTDLRKGSWMSWQYQQEQPMRGAMCCPQCFATAQQHDWPRPAGLVALTPRRGRG